VLPLKLLSEGTPARCDRRGPAYPQDEPGRGTHDGGIVPEPILSSARNFASCLESQPRVSPGMRSQILRIRVYGPFVVGSRVF